MMQETYVLFARRRCMLQFSCVVNTSSAKTVFQNGLREKELALYAGLWFVQLICGRMVMVQQVCFFSYTRFLILLYSLHCHCAIGFCLHEMSCSERKSDQ